MCWCVCACVIQYSAVQPLSDWFISISLWLTCLKDRSHWSYSSLYPLICVRCISMCLCTSNDELIQFWLWWADPEWFSSAPTDWIGSPASLRFCVSGFHRNEDMKAIDVLPILKEKVAFLSGQKTRLRFSQHTHKDRQIHSGSIRLLLIKNTCFCVGLYLCTPTL